MEVLARHAIEDVVEAVPVGEEQELARAPAEIGVQQDRDLGGIDVVDVVWRELEVPFQRAGVDVHGDQRVGVEVVAGPNVADEVGARIAGAPVRQIGVGIVCACHPGGRAAVLPAVAAPCLVARLARPRHGPEAPGPLAARGVVRVEKTTNAVLGAGDADDHLVLDRQRGGRQRVPRLVVGDLDVPPHAAGPHVERDQMRIDRRDEDLVAEGGDAAVHLAAAGPQVLGQAPPVGPQRPSRLDVQRDDVARRIGEVHHAVEHQGRGLEMMATLHLVHPQRAQPLHVVAVDLVQRGESFPVVGAVVGEPAARFARGLADAVVGQLRRQVDGEARPRARTASTVLIAIPPATRDRPPDRPALSSSDDRDSSASASCLHPSRTPPARS